MDIDIFALTYLFLRLAPFILVSFFSLSSIFNQDFKGIVYLISLLISTFIVLLCESFIPASFLDAPSGKDLTCEFLNISSNTPMSRLPLGTGTIAFTFCYLLYTIVQYEYTNYNIPTIIFFSILLGSDIAWQITHTCYSPVNVFITMILFSACGILCSYLIDYLKLVDLQYFTSINGQEVCSRPSKQSFSCSVQKKTPT